MKISIKYINTTTRLYPFSRIEEYPITDNNGVLLDYLVLYITNLISL